MKIIAQSSPERFLAPSRFEGQSGVRQDDSGAWIAIKNGRYVNTFHGKRAFLAATRAAGTNRRLV